MTLLNFKILKTKDLKHNAMDMPTNWINRRL